MRGAKYFTAPARKPTAWVSDDWEEPMRHIPSVSDHEATDTGLLDAMGNTIWRAPNAMGFVWKDEA